MIITSWNIRGLNSPLKQNGVLKHLKNIRPAHGSNRNKAQQPISGEVSQKQAMGLENGGQFQSPSKRLIKSKCMRNNIPFISLGDGTRSSSIKQVNDAFVHYYRGLLGTKRICKRLNPEIVRNGKLLDKSQSLALAFPVTEEEIRNALFSIGVDKTPGPNGYSSLFFKQAWDTVGADFTAAILEFSSSGQILKQINHSIIALIPKSKDADKVEDFRPIACCNVVYKELLRLYSRKRTSPICTLNIDLRKAFDTVDWAFIKDMLAALQFPTTFISWIMACMSSTSFSLAFNGSLHRVLQRADGLKVRGSPIPIPICALSGIPLYNFHAAGICDSNLDRIKDITGFSQGSFPYRYLGIPIADSRLTIPQYTPLIDRISDSISAWTGATLSYADRTELIKSVLQGVEYYWLSILPIPAGVKSKIVQFCRNFLWSGKCTINKKPLVTWKEVTLPKAEGGLGLRNSKAWNKALLSKTLWDIQAKKDSLWSHHVYMKGGCFWGYKNKHVDSHLLKQIMSLRDKIIGAETIVERAVIRLNQ
ncbi:uncharacterized protein LOC130764649 [Actinidia eriantha]|uniref:uncharacterized protein LOC130764649 n=1 Tax=Actinidia eriantha TaxID=165200 RepID=UPI00258A3628|nr:uncharacterized protein LOC130764649 [Actinidia eriantha]